MQPLTSLYYNFTFYVLIIYDARHVFQILSVEIAERIRESSPSEIRGFDEDSLSRLEEDVRDLGILLRTASPLVSQG